jgi:hypothetical protein
MPARSEMSSATFESVGPGKILGYLRGDVRAARKSLLIVGPWIDDYFAAQLTQAARRALSVRVLIRPEGQTEPPVWARMAAAVGLFRAAWPASEVRTLDSLHAKCVLIDDRTAYCGSANWYRFSLEQGCEVTLRGPADAVAGFAADLEELWGRGTELRPGGGFPPPGAPPTGIREEVLDPLAASVLAADPKAFVIGKKRKR